MRAIAAELAALADHLKAEREAILLAWRRSVARDPALTTGDALPRVQLLDHIPAILATFERELADSGPSPEGVCNGSGQANAAAHGLQRWQQGYALREVTRELGKLNECVVAELESYTKVQPQMSHEAAATARKIWAALCSTGIEESVGQYFQLQQREAAGHVKDLENALAEITALEQRRGDLWRQAAHDLRGNLGVVANATAGLAQAGHRDVARREFAGILQRNVTSLHHLLDDITSLARLQAGSEQRRVEQIDVAPVIQQLCEGIRGLAQQRRLFLRSDGPSCFAVEGDAVKIRRIIQNLVLNAVKFTRDGGITVSWGDSDPRDSARWALSISDTGPGLRTGSDSLLAEALEGGQQALSSPQMIHSSNHGQNARLPAAAVPLDDESPNHEAGEGIGLSIVKRLCELLDATIEMESVHEVGTTFRILFPRKYSA